MNIAGELGDTNSIATIVLLRALAHASANEWSAAYTDLEEGKNSIWVDMGIAKVRATEEARQEFAREKEMALANAELRKQQVQKWAAISIGVLALLLALVWYGPSVPRAARPMNSDGRTTRSSAHKRN